MGNLLCCRRAPRARSVLPSVRLDGRVALLTGVSLGGLGFDIALELARRGAHVILAGRSVERVAQAAATIRRIAEREGWPSAPLLSSVQMDLSSLESISHCVTHQLPALSPPLTALHMLIHNAGTLAPTSSASFNAQGVETTVATNYLGAAFLTQQLQAIMMQTSSAERRRAAEQRQQQAGGSGEEKEDCAAAVPYIARVIHLSSRAHTFSALPDRPTRAHVQAILRPKPQYYDSWDAYSHSKLLQLLHARSLGSKFDPATEMMAFAVHPGVVHTRMGRDSCLYSSICCAVGTCFFRSASQGAAPVLMLCLAPSSALESHSGEYFTSAATDPIAPVRVAAAVREPRVAEIVDSVAAEEIAGFELQQRFARSASASASSSAIAAASSAPLPPSHEKDRLISVKHGSGGLDDHFDDLDLEAEVSQWSAQGRGDEIPMDALAEESFESALREQH